jgi:caspase domain-containing protein
MHIVFSKIKAFVFLLLLSVVAVGVSQQESGAGSSAAPDSGARRWALLVGISDYENGTNQEDGWRSLNTGPDLTNMSYVLETYYGFKSPALKILKDENATQENVVREFRQHLIANAKPGDAVVFYYTGHGFHVFDVSGDETADHQDEVTVMWVPKDKQDLPRKERRPVMYMLDDTYQLLLEELSQKMRDENGKVRGSITVIFDSCNSGSATKAVLIPKGRDWNEKIDGPRPADTGKQDVASGWLTPGKSQPEGLTFISGSQSNQFSYMMPASTNKGSILTYYLSEFLTNVAREKTDRKVTYEDMQNWVSAKVLGMGKPQDPQTEGNINAEIFGDGQPVSLQSLPVVRRVLAKSKPLLLELNVGALHGITVGSRFDLYRKNTDVKVPANKLAEVEVTRVSSISSQVKITKPAMPAPQPADYEAAQAVVTDSRFEGQPLRVRLQPAIPLDKAKALSTAISSQTFITTAGVTDRNFDVKLGWKDNFYYQRASGVIIPLGPSIDPDSLQKRLLADWRWKRLAGLTLPGPPKVRIDIVGSDDAPLKRSEGGRIVLKPGDEGKVIVTNDTGEVMFLTLIYLKDSGEIEVFPGREVVNGQQPLTADNKPRHLFNLTDITAPQHVEVEILKIIVTPRAADFTGMSFNAEERKGIRNKGPKNPLEDLLFGFVDAKPKSAELDPVEIDAWYTDQVVYEIRPN